jgi:hypothetical protein
MSSLYSALAVQENNGPRLEDVKAQRWSKAKLAEVESTGQALSLGQQVLQILI